MSNGNATANASANGIGFFGLLTIVLIALKLTGLISISWWWVFSPLIIGFSLWLAIVAIILLLVYIAHKRY
jgi:hypothetical protein